ncbi:MAG: DUF4914 family protein [Bdellovibrionota bacterium]
MRHDEIHGLGKFVRQVLANTVRNGNTVEVITDKAQLLPLICPSDTGVFDIGFDDANGKPFQEGWVTKCANTYLVNLYGGRFLVRPKGPKAIVVADELPSCVPFITDQFPGRDPRSISERCAAWLASQDLLVAGYGFGPAGPDVTNITDPRLAIPGLPDLDESWSLMEMLLVVPKKLAWMVGFAALLERLLSEEHMRTRFQPYSAILSAVGLRNSHFEGSHTTVYFRSETPGEGIAMPLSSYPGDGEKKTMFRKQNEKALSEGWFPSHAAVPVIECPHTKRLKVGRYDRRSGSGKTESWLPVLRSCAALTQDGRIALAKPSEGPMDVVNDDDISIRLAQYCVKRSGVDDISCSPPELQVVPGYEVVINGEIRVFNRTNEGLDNPHRLPMERQILAAGRPDDLELMALNLRGAAGTKLQLNDAFYDDDEGVNRCENPRIVHAVPGAIRHALVIDHVVYGMGTSRSTPRHFDIVKPIVSKQSLAQFVLRWMPGICREKSVSVFNDGAAQAPVNPMIFDPFGSNGSFITQPWHRVANVAFQRMLQAYKTDYYTTAIKWIGCRYVGFHGEAVFQECLAREASGDASWSWVPARNPLDGLVPSKMRIEDNVIPDLLIFPEHRENVGVAAYDAGAAKERGMVAEFIDVLRKSAEALSEQLDPGLEEIFALFAAEGTHEDYEALSRKLTAPIEAAATTV